ncbi:hypothetical protein HYR54_00910 [Candidatus Acetothermia bacterium]|nr:hypothetical protein [Candidatus Acetothermia bacterium]
MDLTQQQIVAARSLARGSTRAEAAREASCGERQIYRWLNQSEFQTALEEFQQEFWTATLSGLRSAALSAVRYLDRVVAGTEESNGNRIKAATALLAGAARLIGWNEQRELEERIALLEGELKSRHVHQQSQPEELVAAVADTGESLS